MAPKYNEEIPKWLREEQEMRRNLNDGAIHYTVDTPFTAYQSRTDNPVAARPNG